MSAYVDFAALKQRVRIEQVARLLELKWEEKGGQLRVTCPVHGGDRGLIVTPAKGLFCCMANNKKGGDCIQLYAHVKQCEPQQAAQAIEKAFGTVTVKQSTVTVSNLRAKPSPPRSAFDAAAYAARLDPEHEALKPLEIAPDVLRAFKAGFASTGKLRGRLALPIADRQGNVQVYVGRALNGEQPTLLYGLDDFDPKGFLFGWDRLEAGDTLYVARDPLDVLKAYDGGISAVSFLGDISATSLQVLSLLLDELGMPCAEFI